MTNVFSVFDKIYCINLPYRKDRWETCLSQFKKYNISNNLEKFDGIVYNNACFNRKQNAHLGCWFSHYTVLKHAQAMHYNKILILEDDFTFLIPKEQFEKELAMLFEKEIQFDVCMLAYNLMESETSVYGPFLKRVLSAQTASAYLVNSTYYDKLIDLYNFAIPVLEKTGQHWIYANDQIWKDLQRKDNWVCFTTRIGKQRAGYSDNGQSYVDYNC